MSTTPTPPQHTWHRAPVDAATAAAGPSPWRTQGEVAQPLSPRSRRGVRVALIFLCLFALCAVLVWVALWLRPAAAPLEAGGRRLYLTRILERLKRLSQHRNIVLVFDATQITAHWPLGMLHSDFAGELEKLNDQIAAMPNLIVISASGVDQR